MRICLGVLFCCLALAQSPGHFSFEAAAIRPGDPGNAMDLVRAGRIYLRIDDSHFSMGNLTLLSLIQQAYEVPSDQITGPDWLNDQRFSMEAKLPAGATKERVPAMLQTLLAERFKLVVHHDLKVLPVYALTVAKDGIKFHESPPGDGSDPGCNGGFHKVCGQTTMESFAIVLSRLGHMNTPGAVDRPVVDKTGLTAKYDFVLDQGVVGGVRGVAVGPDAEIVTVIDAVKTLGLRLEPGKQGFDYIVVDHIERVPTEN